MSETFDTKEEAESCRDKKIEGLNKCTTIGGRFCPLVNSGCVVNCVCFEMPYARFYDDKWYVYGHYCSNEMFMKEEYHVNVNH